MKLYITVYTQHRLLLCRCPARKFSIQSTPPPHTAALATGEIMAVLENGGKESHIHQDKTYLGLENQRQFFGGGGLKEGPYWDDCNYNILFFYTLNINNS